jgi:hypothetical protein
MDNKPASYLHNQSTLHAMAVVALLNAETLDGIQSQPGISVRVRARDTSFHLSFEAERKEMDPNYSGGEREGAEPNRKHSDELG